jgi:hypothetical protein
MLMRISLVLLIIASEPAWAAEPLRLAQVPNPLLQGTPQEQAACRPDATRFCRDAIPDNFRVLACLQAHRDRINRACRAVLEAHGQ